MWLIALYRNAKQMGIYLFSGRTSTDVHQLPNIPLRGTCNSSWVLVPSRMVQRMHATAGCTCYHVPCWGSQRDKNGSYLNIQSGVYDLLHCVVYWDSPERDKEIKLIKHRAFL